MRKPSARWRPISRLIVALAVTGSALSVPACTRAEPTIVDLLRDQAARYPEMSAEDVYKFVQQAAFGNGHLITDEADERRYLQTEFDSVAPGTSEPLIDPLSPDGSVVRVNLRPFKARGLDVTKLYDAMIATAKTFTPSPERFAQWWEQIVDASAHKRLPFEARTLRVLGTDRQRQGYPAGHHSAIYTDRYHPSYRVVLRKIYEDAIAH